MSPADVAFAMVLACSAILAALIAGRANPVSRDYLRFAAALYLAFAVCVGIATIWPDATTLVFADAVMLVILALTPVALALALFARLEHPPSTVIAAILLVLACIAGIAAAASATPVLSLAPLALGALAMVALCARHWSSEKNGVAHAFLSVCCLICGTAASLGGGQTALVLFSSAAVLGFALALGRRSRVGVVSRHDLRSAVAISKKG
ncbi:MAG TPA: hypothetical protein VIM56_13090 [Rhizomicrobium sp.]